MQAVWMVFSRRMAGQFAFLLVIAGHNPRKDRSWNDKLYLVYIVIFFSLWVFAVLTLFASWAAALLKMVGQQSPAVTAVNVMLLALGAIAAAKLWKAAKISPFVFSEDDALLLCLTPVSRRAVAILWFFQHWLMSVLPFAVLAIVLGFAQVEVLAGKELGFLDLPMYIGAGVKALLAMALTYASVLSLVWLFGLMRIRADRDIRHYRWAAAAIIGLFGAARMTVAPALSVLLAPWQRALEAGMGARAYFGGIQLVGVFTFILLGLLWFFAEKLNLSRAAQETAYSQKMQAALWLGDTDTVKRMHIQKRLGGSHVPTRLPIAEGSLVLLWRDVLRYSRGFRFQNLLEFGLILILTVLIFFAPDIGSWLLILAVWVLRLGQAAADKMRATLNHWWLWTQMPFGIEQEMVWQIIPMTVLLSALACLGLLLFVGKVPVLILVILPITIILVIEAGIFDVIRVVSAHSEMLAVESVPSFTLVGAIVALVSLFLPFWFYLQPLTSYSYFFIVGWGIIEISLMWLWIVHLWKNRK